MTSITHDPLLAIAKALLWFLMGVMALAVIACLIAAPTLLIFQNQIVTHMTTDAPKLPMPQFIWSISLICVFAAALTAALFRIFQLLKRIVDTVGQGDPFVPENARRLTQMAWLTLVVQLLTAPIAATAIWLDKLSDEVTTQATFSPLDGNGLLLMLILFILARVFRKGAEMRAELEGTV